MIELPLTSDPSQTFSVVIGGTKFNLEVLRNSRIRPPWSVNFLRGAAPLVYNVPLAGGIDIVKQHNLGISNMYVVNMDNPDVDITTEELGVVGRLFILTDEEMSGG